MKIADALSITAPLECRCVDCGDPILEPNATLCKHCMGLRYADSDPEPREWQDQAADEAGVNRWGPL